MQWVWIKANRYWIEDIWTWWKPTVPFVARSGIAKQGAMCWISTHTESQAVLRHWGKSARMHCVFSGSISCALEFGRQIIRWHIKSSACDIISSFSYFNFSGFWMWNNGYVTFEAFNVLWSSYQIPLEMTKAVQRCSNTYSLCSNITSAATVCSRGREASDFAC